MTTQKTAPRAAAQSDSQTLLPDVGVLIVEAAKRRLASSAGMYPAELVRGALEDAVRELIDHDEDIVFELSHYVLRSTRDRRHAALREGVT